MKQRWAEELTAKSQKLTTGDASGKENEGKANSDVEPSGASKSTMKKEQPKWKMSNAEERRRKEPKLLKQGVESEKASSKHKKEALGSSSEESKPLREHWQVQKDALTKKFGEEGWNPRKKLSPDAIEGIRAMHAQYPEQFTTPVLAKQFEVSPEVIRRILKSKWRPSPEEQDKRMQRWDRRGERIWTKLAEMGQRPPKKWREMGVGRAKPGEAPKWSREFRRKRQHPENIYTTQKKEIIATRAGNTQASAPGESFADRIL